MLGTLTILKHYCWIRRLKAKAVILVDTSPVQWKSLSLGGLFEKDESRKAAGVESWMIRPHRTRRSDDSGLFLHPHLLQCAQSVCRRFLRFPGSTVNVQRR